MTLNLAFGWLQRRESEGVPRRCMSTVKYFSNSYTPNQRRAYWRCSKFSLKIKCITHFLPCPGEEHLSVDEDRSAQEDVPTGGHLAAAENIYVGFWWRKALEMLNWKLVTTAIDVFNVHLR